MSRLSKNQSLLEAAKDDLMKLVDNLPEKQNMFSLLIANLKTSHIH